MTTWAKNNVGRTASGSFTPAIWRPKQNEEKMMHNKVLSSQHSPDRQNCKYIQKHEQTTFQPRTIEEAERLFRSKLKLLQEASACLRPNEEFALDHRDPTAPTLSLRKDD
jgi:hypothetical protein